MGSDYSLRGLIRRAAFALAAFSMISAGAIRMTAASPEPSRAVILLQNRTYTPLWYRTYGGGRWGTWIALLPGQKHQFANLPKLTIEASLSGGAKRYSLTSSNTYYFGRFASEAAPDLRHDADDRGLARWNVIRPPSASEMDQRKRPQNQNQDPFAPLASFVEACEQSGTEYRLSLRELAATCAAAGTNGGTLPAEVRSLYGFSWFFGYVVDPANDDILLIGTKDSTHPPLELDCLATALIAAHTGETPFCSLGTSGKDAYALTQPVIIRGVPGPTRWAEIMIDADYLMKRIGIGQVAPGSPGVQSYWNHSLRLGAQEMVRRGRSTSANYFRGETDDVNRWWFNFDMEQDRAMASVDGQLAILYRNPVRVSTEEISGRFAAGTTSHAADLFATDFTRHLNALGQHHVSIGQLLALYRLYDLACHLRDVAKQPAPGIAFWTQQYQSPFSGPPNELPTLAREEVYRWRDSEWAYKRTQSFRGGVSMRVAITPETLRKTAPLHELADRIRDRR